MTGEENPETRKNGKKGTGKTRKKEEERERTTVVEGGSIPFAAAEEPEPPAGASNVTLPKIAPVSVEATFTHALTLAVPPGASVTGRGRSASLRSPSVASSSATLVSVLRVRLSSVTSSAMS